MAVWICIAVVAMIIVLGLSPIGVEVNYTGSLTRQSIDTRISFLYLFTRHVAFPSHSVRPQASKAPQTAKLIRDDWRIMFPCVMDTLKYISVRELDWNTEIGLGSAADTAISVGVMWSIMGMVVGGLSTIVPLSHAPALMVIPDFSALRFSTQVRCIVRISLGKAIYAGLRLWIILLWLERKRKKEDAHARTSNSVTDADGNGEFEGNGGR